MRRLIAVLSLALGLMAAMLLPALALAGTTDEFVAEAEKLVDGGEVDAAVELLTDALGEHPDDATLHAHLGLYVGMQAGQAAEAGDMVGAGDYMNKSFEILDEAVNLDGDNPKARLYRGLMGVNIPVFFGKLYDAIDDLKHLVSLHEKDPEAVPMDMAVQAYQLLGRGYSNINEYVDAIAAYEKVVELSPGTDEASAAESRISDLIAKAEEAQKASPELHGELDPAEAAALVDEGKAHIEAGEYEEAQKILNEAVTGAPDNAEAHKQYAIALMMPMADGEIYDERIREDTDLATNLAFNVMTHLDKAVELAPDDMETRYLNGQMAVGFPFFLGKLDQGIEYLQMVTKSDLPDNVKAEAAYWLGYAYQKKGMSHWIGIVTKQPDVEAARMVLDGMRPKISHFDPADHPRPVVAIDFLIAFRDELPPQTVVWIERPGEKFLRTIYVSGFSGHAKDAQVNLPVWSSTSRYVDADAVTSASIDTGEHIYTWDLKDGSGRRVEPGKYVIKVEVHHWPSMKYQMVEAELEIGDQETTVVVQEGDFLPYLKVHYMP
jgi:tetratricopeptide (TPR) repeat protein